MTPKIEFTIRQEEEYWSFIAENEIHTGYPDALQATAAAMRFFDPNIPRSSAPLDELIDAIADERRSRFKVITDN